MKFSSEWRLTDQHELRTREPKTHARQAIEILKRRDRSRTRIRTHANSVYMCIVYGYKLMFFFINWNNIKRWKNNVSKCEWLVCVYAVARALYDRAQTSHTHIRIRGEVVVVVVEKSIIKKNKIFFMGASIWCASVRRRTWEYMAHLTECIKIYTN